MPNAHAPLLGCQEYSGAGPALENYVGQRPGAWAHPCDVASRISSVPHSLSLSPLLLGHHLDLSGIGFHSWDANSCIMAPPTPRVHLLTRAFRPALACLTYLPPGKNVHL